VGSFELLLPRYRGEIVGWGRGVQMPSIRGLERLTKETTIRSLTGIPLDLGQRGAIDLAVNSRARRF
jgi:hypothetical protein